MRRSLSFAILVLTALPLLAQPGGDRGGRGGFGGDRGGDRGPGGFGGGGRGGMMNPDDSFNRYLSSYGGTGDVLDYSRVPPESRERYNRFAQMSGSEPMPTSGTISRAQYADAFNKRMEAFNARGGFGGGGFNRGGAPGGSPPGSPPQPGVTVTMSTAPNGPPGSSPMVVGGAPPERSASDDDIRSMIRRYDRDNDGRISLEEAQRTERLKNVFAHYDTNKDAIIDESEMRGYVTDRINNRVPEPPRDGNAGGPPGGGNYPPPGGYGGGYGGGDYGRDNRGNPSPSEEEKPVVLRYGKLPMKELPSWFESLDTDKDGQIGLYEWRDGKKVTNEFVSMDLNSDGLLTAEEYLRFKKTSTSGTLSSDSSSNSRSSQGSSRDSRSSSYRGGSSSDSGNGEKPREDDKRREKEDRKDREKQDRSSRPGENPFRR